MGIQLVTFWQDVSELFGTDSGKRRKSLRVEKTSPLKPLGYSKCDKVHVSNFFDVISDSWKGIYEWLYDITQLTAKIINSAINPV